MSSLSISPTDSLKRHFIPDEDQGPVQKKQKVSSDTEVIACLADTICKFAETFFSPDDEEEIEWEDEDEEAFIQRKAIEFEEECSRRSTFMKPDLSGILGVSDDVDTLYTEVLGRLKETSTRKLEEVEVKASENIPSDSAAVIKKLAEIVGKWAKYFTSECAISYFMADCHSDHSRIVIRILTESSKLNPEVDKVRERYLKAYLDGSESVEPFSSDLDSSSCRFIIRELEEKSKSNPEDGKLREWNINKYLDNTKEGDFYLVNIKEAGFFD